MMLKNKKARYILIGVFLLLFLYFADFTFANELHIIDPGSGTGVKETISRNIAQFLSWIALGLVNFVGWVFTFINDGIRWLLTHLSLSDVYMATAVGEGWSQVRNLCNMFFILGLLIIAFSTILRYENYSIKRMLPKLIIMAVLINFSRFFCELLIGASNILMSSFAGVAASYTGGIVDMLGLNHLLEISKAQNVQLESWSIFYAILLALCLIVISMVVMLGFMIILVGRLVAFAILTILSPLAFLGFAMPGGGRIWSRWWGEFTKYLIAGPALAFFYWVALTIGSNTAQNFKNLREAVSATKVDPQAVNAAVSKIGDWNNMMRFVIGIAILIAALKVVQSIGGMGANAGMNMANNLKNRGLSAGRKVAGAGKKVAGAPLVGAKALSSFGIDKLHQKSGVDLNVARVYSGIKAKRTEKRAERYGKGMASAQRAMTEKGRLWGALAMSGTPGTAWEQILSKKGIKARLRGGKHSSKKLEENEKIAKEAKEKRAEILSSEEKVKLEEQRNEKMDQSDSYTKRAGELEKIIKAPGSSKEQVEKAEKELKALDSMQKTLHKDIENLTSVLQTKKVDDAKAKDYDQDIKKAEKEASKYASLYDFDARAAEQKIVSEKTSKIRDVNDGNELKRILSEAIEDGDAAMIKAVTKKMTQNGDDNEFLQEFAGRTDGKGLQLMMRAMAGDDSKEVINELGKEKFDFLKKAKLNEQEAFGLGSDISVLNKGGNHWAATGAFSMENGQWRTTDEKGMAAYRAVETGKLHNQDILRKLNRLSYGYHDETNKFHLDSGGVNLLRKIDNPDIIKQVGYNMNESAAMNIAPHVDKLVAQGAISPELATAIKNRAAGVPSMEGLERDYEDCKKAAEACA
jgi:hypothetical protein